MSSKNPIFWSLSGKPVVIITLTVVTGLAAGCSSLPSAGETAARRERTAVGAVYRPGDLKPALPVLTARSAPEDYLRYALLNSPTVEAAYYDWFATVEKITAAGTPPDPRLTFQLDIQRVITSLMPGLMVDIPGPGKLAAAAESATVESRVAYYAFERAVLQAAMVLKRAAYGLTLLDRQLELNRQMLAVLADLEAEAEARNASGQATLQDVLRAQIEQERVKATIANLEDARAPFLAKFKAALGLAPDQPEPPVMAIPFPSTPLDLNTNKLLAEALARNPELQGMAAEIRLAETGIKLARLTAVPDFTAGLEADFKMNPILLRPQASMTLPVWRNRIAADIAAAQAGKHAATARLTAGQIALAVEFADLSYQVRESGRNLNLFQNTLLPKARQALEIARDAYRSGGVDFQTVQENQRMVLEFGLAAAEAREQHDSALAELSLIVLARPPPGAPLAK